jgi:hypothetical protein
MVAHADLTYRNSQPTTAQVSLYDTQGNSLDIREGMCTQFNVADGPLYCYGEGSTSGYIPGTVSPAQGFKAYKCQNATGGTDFNCTYQGYILDPNSAFAIANCQGQAANYNGCWRLKMLKNNANGNYVGIFYAFPSSAVVYKMTCTTPIGPCNAPTTLNTSGTVFDIGAFTDDSNNAYFLFNDGSREVFIQALDANFTSLVGSATDTGGNGEALYGFQNGSIYYVGYGGLCANCSGGAVGSIVKASSALGTYGAAVTMNATMCSSQGVNVAKIVAGGQTTYLYVGDRFTGKSSLGGSSTYLQPLTFSAGVPQIFTCNDTVTIAGITGSTYPTPDPGYPTVDQGDFQNNQFRDYVGIDASNWLMQTFVPAQPKVYSVLLGLGKATDGSCAPGGGACTLPMPDGSLEVDLVTVDGSNNPVTTLGSVTFTAANITYGSQAQLITFNQAVTPGNTYGLLLKGVSTTRGQFSSPAASPSSSIYPGGLLRNSTNGGSTWGTFANASLMFDTFAAPASIPLRGRLSLH